MPQYSIYVSCSECGGEHPIGIEIHLDYGPDDKQSIGHAYRGQSLPPQVAAIEGHKALCLKTGKQFVQRNNDQVFLVPAEPASRRVKSEA